MIHLRKAALFHTQKSTTNTVTQHLAAIHFFYGKTLKRAWSITETPYPKKAVRLPCQSQPRASHLLNKPMLLPESKDLESEEGQEGAKSSSSLALYAS